MVNSPVSAGSAVVLLYSAIQTLILKKRLKHTGFSLTAFWARFNVKYSIKIMERAQSVEGQPWRGRLDFKIFSSFFKKATNITGS
jgi:hypothetical protein